MNLHGTHAGMAGGPLQGLINTLKSYIDGYSHLLFMQSEQHWQKQVGRAQLLLPAHVINEYCRNDRSFYPCPDFTEQTLPRTRNIQILACKEEWFEAYYNGGKLGKNFAIQRGVAAKATPMRGHGVKRKKYKEEAFFRDYEAIMALTKVRVQQRDLLLLNLQVSPENLSVFLKLVMEGKQDQAEAMLKNNQALVLFPANITDLSKRSFEGMTAFQYAVWALDWHMWKMLQKYLSPELANAQLGEVGSWVHKHGLHAGGSTGPIQGLIKILEAYIRHCAVWNTEELRHCWQTQVGGAQLLLPAHVINEYCRVDRPFYPYPGFKEKTLPRTRKIDTREWFTAVYNGGKLGEKFGIWRAGRNEAQASKSGAEQGAWSRLRLSNFNRTHLVIDADVIKLLLQVRIEQRDQLFLELKISEKNRDQLEKVAFEENLANAGEIIAQCYIADAYANGKGILQDDSQAAVWYEKAAKQGNSDAQYKLASIYVEGRGLPRDDVLAIGWYRRAAEQGHATAQYNLARMYADGQGVSKDDALAMSWYLKAAEQGHADAKLALKLQAQTNRRNKAKMSQVVSKEDFQMIASSKKQHPNSDAKTTTSAHRAKASGMLRGINSQPKRSSVPLSEVQTLLETSREPSFVYVATTPVSISPEFERSAEFVFLPIMSVGTETPLTDVGCLNKELKTKTVLPARVVEMSEVPKDVSPKLQKSSVSFVSDMSTRAEIPSIKKGGRVFGKSRNVVQERPTASPKPARINSIEKPASPLLVPGYLKTTAAMTGRKTQTKNSRFVQPSRLKREDK